MRQDFRMVGSGGQGVILLSVILAHAYGTYENMEVAQTQSYGPEARGGACRAELVVSDQEIDYVKVNNIDVFVALNEVGFAKFKKDIGPNTIIFADTTLVDPEDLKPYPNVFAIEATQIAEEQFKPFVVNIVMLGFMAAKLDNLSLESAEKALEKLVPPKMLEINRQALHYGYERGMQ